MTFEEILNQALAMLQRQGRVSYRALKRQFGVDDAYIEDLKFEIIEVHRAAVDQDNTMLVWTGDQSSTSPSASASASPQEREPLSYTPPHLAEKILTSRSALEGERKQVTVLFCDLANSTALAERLGPEHMHTLLNRFFALALDAVHRYEGTINQFLGDGFMALFGAPLAHEDHARRAVLAAVALQRALQEHHAELGEPYGVTCAFRMGLNTGLVVVGSIGNNLRMDYSAIGDTTNLAARLQQLAEPGTILVSDVTQRLVEGSVHLEALPPAQVKGKTELVIPYKVVGTRSQRSPLARRGDRVLSQFVGRERELAALAEALEQVESGQGQVIGIVAEAGGGKSRLLYEFRQRLVGRQVTYLEGRCLSYGHAMPYHPIIDLLRNNCGITDADGPETIVGKVRGALHEVGMDVEVSAPYLLQLLGVKEATKPLAVLTPEAIKTRTFETLRQMSLHGSQRRPLIFEIEDLHWCDNTSEDYLAGLVESIAGAAVLLLVTYRPGYRPPWIDKSYATQMALRHLVPQESVTVVRSMSQHHALPEPLERMIVEKAEGNPFFLEELTHAVLDHTDVGADVTVPETIQGVLMARLDRLPEHTKRLLQTAAVLGREFVPLLLEAMWDGAQPLEPLLLTLTRQEFLFARPSAEGPVYVFKHALTQEVAYDSLLTTRRQTLHAAAGQALETLYAPRLEDAYERLAYHYARTNDTAKAVAYLTLVAKKAARNSAHVEAIAHLTQGLELLQTLPATPERSQQELALHIALGPSLIATKGYAASEVAQTYARARQLCHHLEDPHQLFPVLLGLQKYYLVRAELQTAHTLGEQLLALAQQAQDSAMLLAAHRALGAALFWLGAAGSAHTHYAQGMALYDPQQHRAAAVLYGEDAGMACHLYAAWTLWYLGYPDQGLARSHEAVTLAQQSAHPFSLGVALACAAMFHQYRQEGRTAQEHAEAASSLATEQGFPHLRGHGPMYRGWALVRQGQAREGIEPLRQGLTAYRATGAEVARPYFLALLAEAYGTMDQAAAGLTALAEALMLVDTTGERWYEPELHRLKGELRLQQSPDSHAEAHACFQQALDVARSQQAKSLELRAATSLGRLWQQQGKHAEARQLLAEVYGWFTEGFDTPDLREAKALLDELE